MNLDYENASKLSGAVRVIDNLITDAKNGLPDELFYQVSRLTPLVNVDLLVVNHNNEKLLTWRHDSFYGPGWHIPGGIIRFKERWEDRIHLVALKELGVDVRCDQSPLCVTEIFNESRDVRGHFISMLFQCSLLKELPLIARSIGKDFAEVGQWHWFEKMPENTISQHHRFRRLFDDTKFKGF